MYAPFYRAYIPATRAELPAHAGISSGTDASDRANNYPNYLTCDPAAYGDLGGMPHSGDDCSYPFWEKELTLTSVVGGQTGCARRFNNGTPEYRKSPSGDQAIVIYSDEHGEAMTQYVRGWDFHFDQLIAGNPQIITAGNGCDLKDIYPLGTAQIKATARYPGQRVLDVDKTSNTVTETVDNYFTKDVSCVRKGTSGADLLSWICTATAIDIDNTALNDESVCFTAPNAEGIKAYPSGTASTTDALGRICVMTGWSGDAAIEIFGKCSKSNALVSADFTDEKIKRTTTADLSYCPSTATTTTTTTTPTTTTPTTTTTTPRTTTTTPRTTTTTPAATTTTTPAITTTTTTPATTTT